MQVRIDLAKYRLEMAEKAYISSLKNIDADEYLTANNRLYYCIFHCMRAVLALDGFDYKKHSAVISNFNLRYLKTNVFDRTLNKLITKTQEIRNDSDYEDFYVISKPETQGLAEQTKVFLEDVREYVLKRCEPVTDH